MAIPLGALCSTGRTVEDVQWALFRGHATNNHICVHPEQPQGEGAFGYAFADNCERTTLRHALQAIARKLHDSTATSDRADADKQNKWRPHRMPPY
eukprot:jgi/Tetstr1/425722/TSEL_016142.t1